MLCRDLFLLSSASLLSGAQAAETVLGVYIFSRHGDRTSKAWTPTNLTDLGYAQVYQSGSWFRNKYISSGASNRSAGVSSDLVKFSQVAASAPFDTVVMPSALGFLQGLYPPTGEQLGSQTLRNTSTIQTPLNGYQLIPLQTVATGTNSEDSAWLQGSSNCANALVSSNNYFISSEYKALLNSTKDFYSNLLPVMNSTYNSTQASYKNAYASK